MEKFKISMKPAENNITLCVWYDLDRILTAFRIEFPLVHSMMISH